MINRTALPCLFFSFLLTLCSLKSFSQCFEIETILVDACDDSGDEGYNEMVRFNTGAAPVDITGMTVSWPSQAWQGLVQNATTASKVATLNAQIATFGGCGQLVQPVAGVIPANTKVILITSQNFSLTANAFGALTEDVYIIFQDNTTVTAGHFGNYNAVSGIRTLTISFGACSDSVSYDRSLLVDANGAPGASNGAAVNFTPSGVASYTNTGCVAPVDVFSVEAGNAVSACPGAIIPLAATAQGQTAVNWSASEGSFSDNASLNTNYTLPVTATGTIILTLTVNNACGNSISDTVTVTVNAATTPNFNSIAPICAGDAFPNLPTTSLNGITGVWSPAPNNTQTTDYTFTPAAGQCAVGSQLQVVVNPLIAPDFASTLAICSGNPAPLLNVTSPNGISGVWTPATIDNNNSASYLFTPNAGQCATNFTTTVTVTSGNIVPNFQPALTLCSGSVAPVLNTTSPNGINGTWTPATIDNANSASYLFTPNAGQCATNFTTTVTVTSGNIVPDFQPALTLCSGSVAPVLNTTSPNGINGTWTPATINNANSASYLFTPNAGQCATNFTTTVTVTNGNIAPNFQPALTLCSGSVAPILNTTSPNGITGTWTPAIIDNTNNGSYLFTPNAGQCATNFTTTVTVTSGNIVPDFQLVLTLCSGSAAPVLNTTSPNGISGTWTPATIDNTNSASYLFTPNTGQCAVSMTTTVTITPPAIIPTFNLVTSVCAGDLVAPFPTTSTNGITGVWSPAIDNTLTRVYTFVPNAGQCARSVTSTLVVVPKVTPDFATNLNYCNGAVVPALSTTSPNGIVGTWSPPVIDNNQSGNYVFTPAAGQCANPLVCRVVISNDQVVNQQYSLCVDGAGNTINPVRIDTGLSPLLYTFTWTKGGSPIPVTTYFYDATEANSYQIIATDNTTGCTTTFNVTVVSVPPATAFAYVNEDFADQQQIIVEVSGGLGNFLYQLDYGPWQSGNIFAISGGGDYKIHVKDEGECNWFTLEVTALNYPKFFTPNDDGYNDLWNINGMQPSQKGSISIFDRYGKLLKQIAPTGEGWNGKYNGALLPSDDYWFVVSYVTTAGQNRIFRSHFSLKR